MKNDIATINGLIDGISILENNRNEEPYLQTDVLHNKEEQDEKLRDLYRDEGFMVSEYSVVDFGESITLLSNTKETIEHFNTSDVEYIKMDY